MKNSCIAALLLLSANCFSQSSFGRIMDRIHFGVKAGANYSDFTNANFNTEGLVGFHAGAIVGFKISDSFSVEEEVLYSQQGATLKGGLLDGEDIKLSYVTVPIVVKYKTSFGLYLEAGPQVGILVDEDFKALGINSDTDFAEKIDGGIVGGFGYQFENGLGIGARYYISFTDVTKARNAGVNTDFQNNMAQASIFYIF
ncbi:PorT family protein [Flavobacterium zepuense]|uniref:PorT family protein n=1 Tax=Flavobacterium zepuense TaxID=2593302 RepID=A0A552VAT6_9FLAO|nr:PorT family protein [Flavobacterium zepuense]